MKISSDLLADVADVWRKAAEVGESPTMAVHAAYPDRSHRTVSRWVHEAREHGLLAPSKPGSTWLRTPAALAVASALGVPYERLVIALREHAGGCLKIGATEERLARETLAPVSVSKGLLPAFGVAVRAARTEYGWSQKELAVKVGAALGRKVPPLTITRTEAGSRPVPLDEVAAFAAVLNLSLDELLKMQADRPGNDEAAQ